MCMFHAWIFSQIYVLCTNEGPLAPNLWLAATEIQLMVPPWWEIDTLKVKVLMVATHDWKDLLDFQKFMGLKKSFTFQQGDLVPSRKEYTFYPSSVCGPDMNAYNVWCSCCTFIILGNCTVHSCACFVNTPLVCPCCLMGVHDIS